MLNTQRMLNQRLSRVTMAPVQYTAGNPETVDVDNQVPIERIECRLKGSVTVAGGGGSLNANGAGALNLIQSLEIKADGTDVKFKIDGKFLRDIADVHELNPSVATTIAGATATTHTFDIQFSINANAASGFSALLNAPLYNYLRMTVDWDVGTSVISGATTTTVDSGTELQVDVVGWRWTGDQIIEPGVANEYLSYLTTQEDFAVTGSSLDFRRDLQKNEFITRLHLWTFSNSAPSDAVLNSIKIHSGSTVMYNMKREMMQFRNAARYGWSSLRTGYYIVDFCRHEEGRKLDVNDAIIVGGNSPFQIGLDLNNPATDHVYMATERFLLPSEKEKQRVRELKASYKVAG